jgi:CheY-like chemotaxis protein
MVEDNEDDVWLTKLAFDRISAPIEWHVANDGVDALRFLLREPPYVEAPAPDLILVDLNMPRMDGRELLVTLKDDGRLRVIPVIIVSTSAHESDVATAYREHASAYLTKPFYGSGSSDRAKCFADFWLSDVAILPPCTSQLHGARDAREMAPL